MCAVRGVVGLLIELLIEPVVLEELCEVLVDPVVGMGGKPLEHELGDVLVQPGGEFIEAEDRLARLSDVPGPGHQPFRILVLCDVEAGGEDQAHVGQRPHPCARCLCVQRDRAGVLAEAVEGDADAVQLRFAQVPFGEAPELRRPVWIRGVHIRQEAQQGGVTGAGDLLVGIEVAHQPLERIRIRFGEVGRQQLRHVGQERGDDRLLSVLHLEDDVLARVVGQDPHVWSPLSSAGRHSAHRP